MKESNNNQRGTPQGKGARPRIKYQDMEKEQIEKRIKERDEWGVYDINPDLLGGITRISNGVRLALSESLEFVQTSPFVPAWLDLAPSIKNETLCNELKEIARRFISNDFGTFYTRHDVVIKGREWGEYETTKGTIYLHREGQNGEIIVCFYPFER